jgi:serine/threonine protein phosphatase 1
LDIGHLVGIDTYCFGGGYLTAMDLATEDTIQVSRHGHLRKAPLKKLFDGTRSAAKAAGAFCRKWATPAESKATKTAEQSEAG